jgi:hypothetical protein
MKFFKKGDIITIEEGDDFWTTLPEKYIYQNSKSKKLARGHIAVGDEDNMGLDTDYLKGDYIVINADYQGFASGGHGLTGSTSYQYLVECVKIDNHEITIDFFQPASFGSTMNMKKPVGKAEIKYEIYRHNTSKNK